MKKTILSLFCVLALCLGLLPTAALAAGEDAPATLYVGNQQVISGTETTYWSTDPSTGNLTKSNASGNWNVKYESSSNTLTLNGATINGAHDATSPPYGSGIYAPCSSNQSVALTIELIGTNTITGNFGIYVDAQQGETVGTNASLLIRNSSDTGILEVSGSFHGIYVISGTGDASLNINDASVVAKTTQTNSGYAGVCVQSGASATTSPNISLSVDGGSLTASGTGSSDGIQFYVGSSEATNATTSLTVTDNAIVDARTGGISASGVSVNPNVNIGSTGSTGGIVFDGTEGTVYGNVELQKDLEIKSGESLTIGKGASLTVPTGTTLNNNGTISVENGGTLSGKTSGNDVTYKVTGVTLNTDKLPLYTGDSNTLTATIEPSNATNTNLTWSSDSEKVATVDENGTVTAVAPGTATITATAADGSGKTDTCTVTVTDKTYTISVTPDKLDFGTILQNAAQPAAQTVTVTNTGNQQVTVALPTATNFVIEAGEGFADGSAVIEPKKTATFTVQPKAGLDVGLYAEPLTVSNTNGQTASLTATLTVDPVPVASVTLDKSTLALFTGDSATLVANVQPADATNKTVNWASSNPAIVTVDGNGKVTAVAAGTANITATTVDGNKTAVCAVTVTGRTYTLSSDPGAIGFGTVNTGYTQPAAQVVVIKNTGNQALNLTQPKANNYGVGALSKTALNPGETATFIVQPKAGLGAGSYNETLTISGDGGAKATVNLTFSVQAPATATPAPTPLEIHTLHFDTNGGLPLEDVKFGLGAPVELWPYTPVRSGYLFQGWYSDQALTKAVSTIVLVKDTTIYAKWAPDPAATAQSGSTGSGSGSGSGSSGSSGGKGGSGTTITVTPAPTATATPTPEPTVTPTPEPTATPEATTPPEDTDKGSFPVVPVAAGAVILLVLVGGIAIFRRFRD
ncbi:MAG TPA: Ig-like domain-containing protein [Candidatus Gemmiger excrementigallinarum]|uniref:Ig-like domain-containing protein n=1 Tax=Candidatus Gemmiger excrementigallinarum TaxID=2838609 RepID=A0A9D2ES57_9FIRM|nr:Ig-like domain-containing protein [Candidatus Gemmiger excrementigallinarum]